MGKRLSKALTKELDWALVDVVLQMSRRHPAVPIQCLREWLAMRAMWLAGADDDSPWGRYADVRKIINGLRYERRQYPRNVIDETSNKVALKE
jgi:hypothetical protein